MKVTTLLLSQHRRIQNLVAHTASAEDAAAREANALALVQAVSCHIATEERVVYPVVERELALDTTAHRSRHVRARLALFRLATTSPAAFEEHLAGLDQVMREHALAESAIVRALESHLSDAGLNYLGERVHEFRQKMAS